jgi:4'-phosphopantetheinyl transferase
MVELWVADLAVPGWVEQALWEFLDEPEQARAAAFRFDHLRRRFTVSHAMVRAVLGERLDAPPQVLEFTAGPHGKPALAAGGVEFNLSHSGERALLAVSEDGPVGVDIEQFRTLSNLPAMAQRILSPAEHESYRHAVDPTLFVLDAWTRKEAVLKACGDGITRDLRAVDVAAAKRLRVADGYLAAVALETGRPETRVQRWAPSLAGATTSLSIG